MHADLSPAGSFRLAALMIWCNSRQARLRMGSGALFDFMHARIKIEPNQIRTRSIALHGGYANPGIPVAIDAPADSAQLELLAGCPWHDWQ